jgi:hypothetical protein
VAVDAVGLAVEKVERVVPVQQGLVSHAMTVVSPRQKSEAFRRE